MSSTVETEHVEIFEREAKELCQTASKYSSLELGDVNAVVHAFRLAIEQDGDDVTAQRLFEVINQR
jgi:hypothetical protein